MTMVYEEMPDEPIGCGTEIVDGVPSSASLSANEDKYKVTYLFNDKHILRWKYMTVVVES
jgi:hypothetical protein